MRRCFVFLLLGVLAVFPACDSGSEPPLSLTGTWVGQRDQQGQTVALKMDLHQQGPAISGTGTLSLEGGTSTFQAEGSYTHPNITLTLSFAMQRPGQLEGTVSEERDRMQAELFGTNAGFGGAAIELFKQE